MSRFRKVAVAALFASSVVVDPLLARADPAQDLLSQIGLVYGTTSVVGLLAAQVGAQSLVPPSPLPNPPAGYCSAVANAISQYRSLSLTASSVQPLAAAVQQQAIFAGLTAAAPLLQKPIIALAGPSLGLWASGDQLAFMGLTTLSVPVIAPALANGFLTGATLTASAEQCPNLPAPLQPQPVVAATSYTAACPSRPSGPLAFQTAAGSNLFAAINPDTGQVYEKIADPRGPALLHVSPDGSKLYIDEIQSSVSIFDTCTMQFTKTIKIVGPIALSTLSPDGKRLYTANLIGASADVIDTASGTIIDVIPYANVPTATGVSPDNSTFYVSDFTGDITSYSAATFQPIAHATTLGYFPGWFDVSPDGKYVYVANEGDGVTVFDAKTLAIKGQIYTGFMSAPQYVTTRPDGNEIWITNANGTVDVISTTGGTFAITKVIAFDSLVWTVSFSNDSTKAYVSEEGNPVETLLAGENSDFLALFKLFPNETVGQTRTISTSTYKDLQAPIIIGISPGNLSRLPGT